MEGKRNQVKHLAGTPCALSPTPLLQMLIGMGMPFSVREAIKEEGRHKDGY